MLLKKNLKINIPESFKENFLAQISLKDFILI